MKMQFDEQGKLIIPEPTRPLDENNIVFKCNWNDAGWKGICSKGAREFNVLKNRAWCCDSRNECEKLVKEGKKGFPCYESCLFVDFVMEPGTYLDGEKGVIQEEMYIRGGQKGKVAFLTTVSPGMQGKDRYFIGIFDIEKIENERKVYGNKETSIVITPKIKIKYWDYGHNKDGSKRWSSKLFRYIDDETALRILRDLKKEYDKLMGFEKEKTNLNKLIEKYQEYLKN